MTFSPSTAENEGSELIARIGWGLGNGNRLEKGAINPPRRECYEGMLGGRNSKQSRCHWRGAVDCVPYSSQSGFIDKPCCSQSTLARVRVREGLSPIRDHESYFRAWRVA